MKAIMKKERKPGLWMEEVPMAVCGDDEVLIKTKKNAICGTDVHIYNWDAWAQKTIPVPMIIGHEFMGHIYQVGKNVKNLKVGQRVCGEAHSICGLCPACLTDRRHQCMNTKGLGVNRPGSFAEYFPLAAQNVFVLPETISDDVAAIFDPFGNAVHTALKFDVTTQDVLITGAGPIGIMAAAVAKKAGAHQVVITDLNDYHLDLAKKMGAITVNIKKEKLEDTMQKHGIKHGFSVGFEMSGNPNGLNTLLEKVSNGGRIALLGIIPSGTGIDWDLVIFKMLTLQGIYGREIFSTWYKMVHLLESGLNLSSVITHHFNIDDFEKGFQVMLSGQAGKVILDWE